MKDLIKPNSFKFIFGENNMADIELAITEINVPDVSIANAIVTEMYRSPQFGGTKIEYAQVTINFIVDEDLSNWLQLFDWIKMVRAGEMLYPDGHVYIMTNRNNYFMRFNYLKMIPENLSGLNFNVTDSSLATMSADATFSVYEMTYEGVEQ